MTAPKPRALSVRPDSVPEELKEAPQWVVWPWSNRNGKWTKPPHRADGSNADVAQPGTWTSFAVALSGYETGRFAGVGFVLTADDRKERSLSIGIGYVLHNDLGVDLDHVMGRTASCKPGRRTSSNQSTAIPRLARRGQAPIDDYIARLLPQCATN